MKNQERLSTAHSRRLKGVILALFVLTLGVSAETKADPVSLGAASGFTVLGIGNTKISINGGNGVHGTIGSNGQIALDNPSNIFGDVILGSGGSFKSTAKLAVASTQNAALIAQAAADARAASMFAAGLAATNSLTTIHLSNSSQTINGGAIVNVINLTSVNLNHGTLILSAPAGGSFVLNVSGDFVLDTGSILLAGGLTANDVLINVTGPGSNVAFTGGGNASVVNGTILSVDRDVQLSPGMVNGRIIGGGNQITLVSGSNVNGPPPAVPEPTTMLLLGTGLVGVAARIRKRRKQKTEEQV